MKTLLATSEPTVTESKPLRLISTGERKILALAVQGLTDKEICRELGLSITTIRTHWTRLRKKLNAVNRAQAIAETIGMKTQAQKSVLDARLRSMHQILNEKGVGFWEWDVEKDRVTADDLCSRIFGPAPEGEYATIDSFLCSIPQEERIKLLKFVRSPKSAQTDGVTHRIRIRETRMILARTRMTRVAGNDQILVFTTETVAKAA